MKEFYRADMLLELKNLHLYLDKDSEFFYNKIKECYFAMRIREDLKFDKYDYSYIKAIIGENIITEIYNNYKKINKGKKYDIYLFRILEKLYNAKPVKLKEDKYITAHKRIFYSNIKDVDYFTIKDNFYKDYLNIKDNVGFRKYKQKINIYFKPEDDYEIVETLNYILNFLNMDDVGNNNYRRLMNYCLTNIKDSSLIKEHLGQMAKSSLTVSLQEKVCYELNYNKVLFDDIELSNDFIHFTSDKIDIKLKKDVYYNLLKRHFRET